LSLWSNAVEALDRLGLRDEVVAQSDPIERAITLTAEGELLSDVSLVEVAREIGQPSICVHRADLQQVLAGALVPGTIRLGADCVAIDEDAEGVTAHFADGSAERGDVLVGADGIRSVVRERLNGAAPPRYAGYYAFRGVARFDPSDMPRGAGTFGLGHGAQAGFVRCGGGRVYWFATINAPEGTTIAPGSRKKRALELFRGWFPLATAAIEATDEDAVLVNDIVDRPVAARWGRGRVTLLGDAAHPTTPNLGQGACQALEDAVVLVDALKRHGIGEAALRRYEAARQSRTAMIQRQSWQLGKVFQLENGLAIRIRNALIRTSFGQRRTASSLRAVLRHALPA